MTEHDHTGRPKVWCTRCQHEHIASIPATTYMCDSCGFGQWDLGSAAVHEASTPGHRTYPIAHPTVPLDERPPVPTAVGVLHEVVTRIDEARSANEDTSSPWVNSSVLELLAHLREPYTEGGATAAAEPSVQPPTREQAYEAVSAAVGGKSLTHWERAAIDALLALFPQPTPRESGFYCEEDDPADTRLCTCRKGQKPVSIADMVPGTCDECGGSGVCGSPPDHYYDCPRCSGEPVDLDDTRDDRDPSTIRDVTPPPATPEGGQ
jgi:hypothetical protein